MTLAKDAFDLLRDAVEIKYSNTEVWKLEEGEDEHPLVPALRAAAMNEVINEPYEDLGAGIDDMQHQLVEERRTNERLRNFMGRLQDVAEIGGWKGQGPDDILKWLAERLA